MCQPPTQGKNDSAPAEKGTGKPPYCTVCGKPQELRETGYFDEKTGEHKKAFVCMTYGCAWNQICRGNDDHKGSWLFTDLLGGRCVKCGNHFYRGA